MSSSIICGVDLSDSSAPLAEAGAALARKLQARLWLAHVLDQSVNALPLDRRERVRANAVNRLAEECRRLAAAFGIEAVPSVLTGSASEELLALADAQHAADGLNHATSLPSLLV
jgi:hypothetical protein